MHSRRWILVCGLALAGCTSSDAVEPYPLPDGDESAEAPDAGAEAVEEKAYVIPDSLLAKPNLIAQRTYTGFMVTYVGRLSSGPFRIAVLAGANSYSIHSGSMAPRTTQGFQLPTTMCGHAVTVIFDIDDVVREGNEQDNAVGGHGPCNL